MPRFKIDPKFPPNSAAAKDLFWRVPVPEGKTLDDVDLKHLNPESLLEHGGAEGADVVRWAFGGTYRVRRIGSKVTLDAAEVGFLAGKGLLPMLTPLTEVDPDDDDAAPALAKQLSELDRKHSGALVEIDTLRSQVKAAQSSKDAEAQRAAAVVDENKSLKKQIADAADALKKANAETKKAKETDVTVELERTKSEKASLEDRVKQLLAELAASKQAPTPPPTDQPKK